MVYERIADKAGSVFCVTNSRLYASSKLLYINLFCCSISYVNCSRPYCERWPKHNALSHFRRLINIKLLKTYNMRVVLIYERRHESLFDNHTKGSPQSPMGMQKGHTCVFGGELDLNIVLLNSAMIIRSVLLKKAIFRFS